MRFNYSENFNPENLKIWGTLFPQRYPTYISNFDSLFSYSKYSTFNWTWSRELGQAKPVDTPRQMMNYVAYPAEYYLGGVVEEGDNEVH